MLDIEKKPSLRISPNVYGRTSVRNKVKYLIDPKGGGSDMGVPERVVLTRWRQRKFANHRFSGDKLSSTLWRAVAAVYGKNATKICRLSTEQLEKIKVTQSKLDEKQTHLKLPASNIMFALFFICGSERLQVLLDKHTSKEHEGRSGVPDLFLFAVSTVTGKPSIARFVEVKKPGEKISQDQIDEIELLNSMGLHARVMRLVEMPNAKVRKNFRAC
jgi:hypothetical protein